MKRATLIVLFLAALFVLLTSLAFRGCNRPARVAADGPYHFQLHASVTPVPEPSTYALWGVGALTLIVVTRKRK